MTVSFRLWHRKLGGHVHVRVFSSEFGPATTHGLDGTLTMRPETWEAFRALLQAGDARFEELLATRSDGPVVEFVDETEEATA